MKIILNEKVWAEDAISSGRLGDKPTETLIRVAKYYLAEGFSKKEARQRTEDFLVRCNPNVSVVCWSDTMDYVMRTAERYPLVRLDKIGISHGELQTIRALGKRQLMRLAFTLLCVSKYWDAVSADNNHWVNERDVDIMHMANISTSVRLQSMLFAKLREAGLIRFSSKVDNLNVQVLFGDEGEPELFIHDYRNLGYQYLKWFGEPYIECASCGITVKSAQGPGAPRKYCQECAAKIKIEKSVNSVMRRREERDRVRKHADS